jgi:hypothetical protein
MCSSVAKRATHTALFIAVFEEDGETFINIGLAGLKHGERW